MHETQWERVVDVNFEFHPEEILLVNTFYLGIMLKPAGDFRERNKAKKIIKAKDEDDPT